MDEPPVYETIAALKLYIKTIREAHADATRQLFGATGELQKVKEERDELRRACQEVLEEYEEFREQGLTDGCVRRIKEALKTP